MGIQIAVKPFIDPAATSLSNLFSFVFLKPIGIEIDTFMKLLLFELGPHLYHGVYRIELT